MLQLPGRSEELRFGNSRNHSAIKRAVNKAARMGVEVRQAESEDQLRAWYALYLDTMRWHAVPPRPYRFFKNCWELLRPHGLMRLLLAEQHEAGHEVREDPIQGVADRVGVAVYRDEHLGTEHHDQHGE